MKFLLLMVLIGTVIFLGCADVEEASQIIEPVMRNDTVEPVPPIVAVPNTADADASQDMVLIPSGEFQMGSNAPEAFIDEQPVRTVDVSAFYMDEREVTNAQYREFVLAHPRWQKDSIAVDLHDGNYLKHWNRNNYPSGKGNHPVVYVSWYAARAYAEWAGKRLPTEAEWEKAARGRLVSRKYPRGNSIDANGANYGRRIGDTVRVGRYPANGYGLYDMAGNVWEWCSGVYDNVKNSRVMRGGSWSVHALDVRVSFRGWDVPTFTSDDVGFRCVKDVRP